MDESDGLENRCASYFYHQRLGPMKEAPSNEGAFLVSATPPIGKAPGGEVLMTVWAWLVGAISDLAPGPPGSSSATPNLAWNVGRSSPEYRGSTIRW